MDQQEVRQRSAKAHVDWAAEAAGQAGQPATLDQVSLLLGRLIAVTDQLYTQVDFMRELYERGLPSPLTKSRHDEGIL